MSYKQLTDAVVGTVFDWALLDNGYVTTLDVKNYVRSKGYWATQDIIREALEREYETAQDLVFEIEKDKWMKVSVRHVSTNGTTHKEYYLEEVENDLGETDTCEDADSDASEEEVIWGFIKDNPDLRSYEIVNALERVGINTHDYQIRGIKAAIKKRQ